MKRILNTSKYDWIFPLVLFIIFTISLICLLVFYIPYQTENNGLVISLICIMSVIIFITLVTFLLAFQYVILGKNGIKFRCLICSYPLIEWKEIDNLKLVKLNTSSSIVGMKYYHYFIEIQTKDKKYKHNKIIYNKKNLNYLLSYLKKYTNVDTSSLYQNLDSKSEIKWF